MLVVIYLLINLTVTFVSGVDFKCDANSGKNCVCKEKPCFRKCCRLGEAYVDEECVRHDLPPESISVRLFQEDDIPDEYNLRTVVNLIYGVPCRGIDKGGAYAGEHFKQFTDGSSLLVARKNGSKISRDLYLGTKDYCADFKDRHSDKIRIIFCYGNFKMSPLLYYSSFCILISIPFLLVTEAVFILLEGFSDNLPGKITISQTFSLTFSLFVLADIRFVGLTRDKTVCGAFGYIAQYGILSNFFWLNIMCFDIWLVFSGFSTPFRNLTKDEELKKFLKYAIYAWGSPVLICSATYLADILLAKDSEFRPAVGEDFCLLKPNYSRLVFYFLPLTILLLLNVSMFAATAYKIYSHKKEMAVLKSDGSNIANNTMEKERLNLYFKLFLVMGITWTTEPISKIFDERPEWLWTLLDSINLLQGIPIFLIFVCKRRTLLALSAKLCPSNECIQRFLRTTPLFNTTVQRESSNVNAPGTQTSSASASNHCSKKNKYSLETYKDKNLAMEMVQKENSYRSYDIALEV